MRGDRMSELVEAAQGWMREGAVLEAPGKDADNVYQADNTGGISAREGPRPPPGHVGGSRIGPSERRKSLPSQLLQP